MADDWWQNDPIASAPVAGGGRVGFIPGQPKPEKPPQGYRDDGNGGLIPVKGGPADPYRPGGELDPNKPPKGDEKPTQSEQTSSFLTTRLVGALNRMGGAIKADPSAQKPPILPKIVGMIDEDWANSITDTERQIIEAAQEDAVDAALTLGTGAAYNKEQLAGYKKAYFPQIGDSDATIKSKQEAFRTLVEAAKLKSGSSAGQIDAALAAAGIVPVESVLKNENQTPNGTHIYDDSQNRGVMGLSQSGGVAGQDGGGTHTETNPALQGINGQVNEMLKGGASDKEIIALLKSRGADTASLVAVKTQLNDIRKFQKGPGRNYKGDYNIDLERYDTPNSGWQNLASSPLGTAGLTMADTFTGGHVDNVVGALGGDPELANLGIQLSRETNPKAALAGDVAGGAGAYLAGSQALRAAGVAPQAGKISMFAPRAMAGDAALGGYVSSGQGTTDLVDPGNVVKGLLLGVGTGAATRGLLNGAGAAISPTGGDLAPLYEAGVRPTVGQRLGAGNFLGRSLNRAEQAFGSVPVLGGIQRAGRNAAVSEMQTGAFNQALGEIGLQLPKGITKGKRAHAFMQKAFDDIYDRARSGMQFSPDDGFATDISAIAEDAGMLFPQSKAIVQKISDDIGSKVASSGGTLSGDQFKVVVSRLGKKIGALRSSPNGDTELADVLDSMKTAIENAARRQSNPEAVALLDAADRGYAKAVIIENAGKARGGEAGEFNGTQLDASVQRTDKSRRSRAYQRGEANMQKYGEAAKKLGDELPDSGTAERVATLATAGGAAHFISPAALLPWAADTAANLPGVRQTLGALMAPRPQAIREQTDAARHFLEMLARVAPAVSIPVAE